MNRALAAVVAAAVTAPVALITALPVTAQGRPPSALAQQQSTYEELRKAAAEANTAYDKAVTSQQEGRTELEATLKALESSSHPLNAAWRAADQAADQAADDAAEAKDAAGQKVTDAKAALEAAESEADQAAAQKDLDQAETALAEAVAALDAARAKAKTARTELDDARVAATRKYHLVQQALKEARSAKEAADKALAEAKECVRETTLTSAAVGLPAKVVAGDTVDFRFRIDNGTARTLDVDPLTGAHLKGEQDDALKVQWSDGSGWHSLDQDEFAEHLDRIEALKPGEHSDVKMRLTVDAETARGEGYALFAADASDAYKPCVLGPRKRYDFEVLPAGSEPGEVGDAKPGEPGEDDDKRPAAKPGSDAGTGAGGGSGPGASAQGGAGKPVAEGDLAATGASSASMPLALAGAGAVALGAGAVWLVRRRRAAADS